MTLAEHTFSCCIKADGRELHLVLEGELDVATTPILLDCFQAGISLGKPETICLDVSSLDDVDSAGASLLVMMQKRAQANGTKFTIRFPSEKFLQFLRVADLTTYFDCDDTGIHGHSQMSGSARRLPMTIPEDPTPVEPVPEPNPPSPVPEPEPLAVVARVDSQTSHETVGGRSMSRARAI